MRLPVQSLMNAFQPQFLRIATYLHFISRDSNVPSAATNALLLCYTSCKVNGHSDEGDGLPQERSTESDGFARRLVFEVEREEEYYGYIYTYLYDVR